MVTGDPLAETTNQPKTKMINSNIEIIEDNAGGLTIQNTESKDVAYFDHKSHAMDSLKAIIEGDDMSGWELSAPEYYISDQEFLKHSGGGGYRSWDEDKIREHLEA